MRKLTPIWRKRRIQQIRSNRFFDILATNSRLQLEWLPHALVASRRNTQPASQSVVETVVLIHSQKDKAIENKQLLLKHHVWRKQKKNIQKMLLGMGKWRVPSSGSPIFKILMTRLNRAPYHFVDVLCTCASKAYLRNSAEEKNACHS